MAENNNFPADGDALMMEEAASEGSIAGGGNPFEGGEASGFGGGVLGDPLAPDEGYEYDFASGGLPMRTPFDDLLEFDEFDNIGDIFGDMDGENPFADGAPSGSAAPDGGGMGGENPFAGGMPSDSAAPIEGSGDNASEDPFSNFNPNTDGSPFTDSDDSTDETADGVEEMPSGGGGSMMGMGGGFSGSIDTGTGNTDNGNGNNFLGDSEGNSGSNNQADGNGNWFYGNDNQAEGNGNWSFGEGNQINGNGNWNLNQEEGGTPFDDLFAGDNNPLAGGNPLGFGEEGGAPLGEMGGNNPVLAGGSTTPTPVGDGETPDSAENPTGNQNAINGNGNWNFGSENTVSGNGNWGFGDENVIDNGNGNWSLGDNNQVSGNGNRPTGSDNSVSGNSNRVSGSGNDVFGNRFNIEDDDSSIYGNGDRYFSTDEDGNVTLVSDESASDPNYTFDFEGVVNNGSADELLSGGEDSNLGDSGEEIVTDVYESLSGTGTGSLPSSDLSTGSAAGTFPEGEVPTDVPPDVLPVA